MISRPPWYTESMSNPLDSLSRLRKAARAGAWFRDVRLVYQGFGPLAAHMFHHFMPVSGIVANFYGEDVQTYIEKGWGTPVFSYEAMKGVRHNSVNLFNDYFYKDHGDEIARKFNRLDGTVCFAPFNTTPALHDFLFSHGRHYRLLQNPVIVQNYFDYKARLAWRAAEIGIPIPPESEVSLFGELDYKRLRDRYKGSFVIQIPLSTAGSGTDFVHSEDDFKEICERRRKEFGKMFEKTQVKITPYMAGPSLNCTACVINGEVALSQPDIQIVGDPAMVSTAGQYIGSDFSQHAIPARIRKQILDAMLKTGRWMGAHGYRGNFGLDFLTTTDKTGRVDAIYVSEINARLVGESQYMADFQAMKNVVPLTFFHLAEFLDLDIKPAWVRAYNRALPAIEGSALLVYNRRKGTFRSPGKLTTGIYRMRDGRLERIRDGYLLSETKSSDEFVITNGTPWKDLVIGHPRYGDSEVFLCYIMTRESIVDPKNWRRVNDKWRGLTDIVRDAIHLEPCPYRSLAEERSYAP
ncbi:hypothetical protein HY522_12405 [bacterium]|nr:hypothetical protein [bacterium]